MNLPDNIKKRLVTKITGVNIHFETQEVLRISYVLLKVEKGISQIAETSANLQSIDELLDVCDKKVPLWLSITGRPVITRILDEDPGSQYLNYILPNAKEDDFQLSILPQASGKLIISAIRKEQFLHITDRIKEKGFSVLGCSLGVAALEFLHQSKLMEEARVEVPGNTVHFTDGEIQSIVSGDGQTSCSYFIGDDQVEKDILLPFTTALVFLASRKGHDFFLGDKYDREQENFILSKLNRIVALGVLGLVFIVLMANYFIFSHLNTKYQTLSDELSYQQVFFTKKDSLQKEIASKTKLVKQMGLSEKSSYGYYIDRIAAIVPAGISLKRFHLNPIDDELKENKPLSIQNYIIIEGQSKGSITLNEWLNELEKYEWLDAELIWYERTENEGNFKIKIIY